jgi:hypothetical protein
MKNFEKYTKPLQPEERRIAVIICERFKKKPGKGNIVTNKQIVRALFKKYQIKITEPRIRKIIQYIRANALLNGLIATSSGYWLTRDHDELKSWIESMIERENAIRDSRQAGERDLRFFNDQTNQSRLF